MAYQLICNPWHVFLVGLTVPEIICLCEVMSSCLSYADSSLLSVGGTLYVT